MSEAACSEKAYTVNKYHLKPGPFEQGSSYCVRGVGKGEGVWVDVRGSVGGCTRGCFSYHNALRTVYTGLGKGEGICVDVRGSVGGCTRGYLS